MADKIATKSTFWEGKKHTPPCSSEERLFAEKMRARDGRFRWPIWFSWFFFNRVFVSTTGLESFSLRPFFNSPNDLLSVVVVYTFFFSDFGQILKRFGSVDSR